MCGLFGEHKFHELIIKKDLPQNIKESFEQVSGILKRLEFVPQLKEYCNLDEFVLHKFKESVEEKKKQLLVLYKQVKNIVKQSMFGFVEEIQKENQQLLQNYLGSEVQSFQKFKLFLENVETKLAEIKQKRTEKNADHVKIFLELEDLKIKTEKLKEVDLVFKNVKENCCEFKIDMDLKLNRINDLFDFRSYELETQELKRLKSLLSNLFNKKLSSKHFRDEELISYLTPEEYGHGPGVAQREFHSSVRTLEFVVPQLNRSSIQNKLRKGSDAPLEIQTRMTLLAPSETTLPASVRHRPSIQTPKMTTFGNQFHSLTNNPTKQNARKKSDRGTFFESPLGNPIINMESFMSNKNPILVSEKRELIRPNLYVLKDGVAVISNHSINEEKMRMVMSQILSAEIFIFKILFRRNLFLIDPLSFLNSFIESELVTEMSIDLSDNRFSKSKLPSQTEVSFLAKKNVVIKV